MNVKLPKYASTFDNGPDDSNGEDDEAALELKRLKNAVEEYKFKTEEYKYKFLALKKEVEDKQLMEVE